MMAPSRNIRSLNSSIVAIGSAGAFVILSTVLGVTSAQHDRKALETAAWTLRGAIVPDAVAAPPTAPNRSN